MMRPTPPSLSNRFSSEDDITASRKQGCKHHSMKHSTPRGTPHPENPRTRNNATSFKPIDSALAHEDTNDSDSDSDANGEESNNTTSKPPTNGTSTPPLRELSFASSHAFPPFPTFTTRKTLRDFYNGVVITIENMADDQEADKTRSLLQIVKELEDNQPTFTEDRGEYRHMVVKGGTYVFEAIKTFVRERPGIATSEVCRVLDEHSSGEMERREKKLK